VRDTQPRRRTNSSSIIAMCAAGPPNAVSPSRRKGRARSRSAPVGRVLVALLIAPDRLITLSDIDIDSRPLIKTCQGRARFWSLKAKDIAVRGSKKSEEQGSAEDQQLYSGLIRLHVLHHAAERPVYGLWLIEELARHGYKLSSGTLYPMLHNLEEKGYLRSVEERSGKLARRVYRATALGEQALESAKRKVSELFMELFEEMKESKRRLGDRKVQRGR